MWQKCVWSLKLIITVITTWRAQCTSTQLQTIFSTIVVVKFQHLRLESVKTAAYRIMIQFLTRYWDELYNSDCTHSCCGSELDFHNQLKTWNTYQMFLFILSNDVHFVAGTKEVERFQGWCWESQILDWKKYPKEHKLVSVIFAKLL